MSCLSDVIDTFDHRYTRWYTEGKQASARLKLTHADNRQLFLLVQQASFFELSPVLSAPHVLQEPGGFDELTVRSEGRTHTVRLDAAIDESPEIERFQRLVRAISDLVSRRPEVKRLPSYAHVCM